MNVENRIARLEAYKDICNLQGPYNHYLATGQIRDKLPELFAFRTPGVKAEICDSGMWEGPDGIVKLFQHVAAKYHIRGSLFFHLLMTPVVEISRDGHVARGMWHSLGTNTYLTSQGKLDAMWQLGKYDNIFVKEDGQWKFLEFKWYVIFRTPFHEGWVKRPIVEGLHQEGFPAISPLHNPYDPAKDNVFLPFPPEQGEL